MCSNRKRRGLMQLVVAVLIVGGVLLGFSALSVLGMWFWAQSVTVTQ